jgi:hypothetical protein
LSLEAKRGAGIVRRDERVAAARDAALNPQSRRSTD